MKNAGSWGKTSDGDTAVRETHNLQRGFAVLICALIGVTCGADSTRGQNQTESKTLLSPDLLPADAIDRYIDARLLQQGVIATAPATPYTMLRRLTLDLAGRIPTTHEIDSFLKAPVAVRRARFTAKLMAGPWYVRHTARELNRFLQGVGGNGPDLMDYLVSAVAENRSWDQMFRELVGVVPAAHRPERFVLGRLKDRDLLTRDVSAIYFGINISCAQCHTHPYIDSLTQEYFFGMKSFFSRSYEFEGHLLERHYGEKIAYEPVGEAVRSAEVMFLSGEVVTLPASDAGDLKKAIAEEQRQIELLRKQYREARKKDAAASPQIPADAAVKVRQRLVDIALNRDNEELFARSIVNRVWHRFMGYGLVMRVDQMHASNVGSHPQLLAWLARDMVAHGYDLGRLTRAIVASKAYGRSSEWDAGSAPPPAEFAVKRLRALTPMQMSVSMLIAGADLQKTEGPPEPLEAQLIQLEDKASAMFAEVFEVPHDEYQFNAAEALAMSNNAMRLAGIGEPLVASLSSLSDYRQQAETAVLSVLGRPAVSEEIEWIEEYLSAHSDRHQALQQVVWALFTSSEFRFNF